MASNNKKIISTKEFDVNRVTLGNAYKPKFSEKTQFELLYDNQPFVLDFGVLESRSGLCRWDGQVGSWVKSVITNANDVKWALKEKPNPKNEEKKGPPRLVRGKVTMELQLRGVNNEGTPQDIAFKVVDQLNNHVAKILATEDLRYRNGQIFWDADKRRAHKITPEVLQATMKTSLSGDRFGEFAPNISVDVPYAVIRNGQTIRLGDEKQFPLDELRLVTPETGFFSFETGNPIDAQELPTLLAKGVRGQWILAPGNVMVESGAQFAFRFSLLQGDVVPIPPYVEEYKAPERIKRQCVDNVSA